MKYIKKYEMIYDIDDFDINYFIYELGDSIDKIIKDFPLIITKKTTDSLYLAHGDSRRNSNYQYYRTFLTIKQYHLKDKKMKDIDSSYRQKIRINFVYDDNVIYKDKGTALNLINFLKDIFRKNSYHHQVISWNEKYNDFFIEKSKIPKILYEIENDFELFINTSKYNI